MKSNQEIVDIINHGSASDIRHQFSSIPFFPMITDGVNALAEAAECYWLLDILGSYQTNKRLDKEFQVWVLEVNHNDDTAVVRGYNDTELIITQEIPFTDFPLEHVKLYLADGVIMLLSEY